MSFSEGPPASLAFGDVEAVLGVLLGVLGALRVTDHLGLRSEV